MNVTYLLGAGASANRIPVVKEFNKNIEKFKSRIEFEFNTENLRFNDSDRQITISPTQAKERLIKDYEWLINESANFSTIDTFAKKLALTGDRNYKKLKYLLSFFLTAVQSTKQNDYRYDNLFAALLGIKNGKVEVPKNLSIVTWNYDLQTEIAASKFLQRQLDQAFFEYLQSSAALCNIDNSKFQLIKLNGTAGFYGNIQNRVFDLGIAENSSNGVNTSKELLNYLSRIDTNIETYLSFSWDKETFIDNSRKLALETFSKSRFLIIIGYSFPVFNREVDRQLLKNFSKDGTIYIQDKYNSINIMHTVSELSGLKDDQVKIIESNDEFYIPLEYSPEY
ncbi:hypothetical protein LPTSP3_g31690 [Leptospira kobayashii]|uniref:SIR2-like domain-containing protein n=1 Tax=Leptospira kobayashii TaxID=1917830 RepID=A0ABM7USN0_9LEPT|nr:hypothetical protein [Leptospira kobayashii]BDA80239.1 hypothetical protein LPTSP3_g31690 [Leptospira kobayashii]